MNLELTNKIALITGASKGLGFATALSFAKEGAKIVICSRDEKNIHTAAEKIRAETGAEVFALTADLTRAKDIRQLVKTATEKFGTIHICVTNTGGPPSMPFLELDDEKWLRGIELTLMSAVRLSREVIPHMQKQKWGRILHICSASVKNPIPNLMLSNSIRAAVVAMAKTQSYELAKDNILVNSILPGMTDTERTGELMKARAKYQNIKVEEAIAARKAAIPLGRLGRPEELADSIVFLASERASFITGTVLAVDGGETKFPF
jgi:3-oxoacyl-[acyl-carrier protein] reductase